MDDTTSVTAAQTERMAADADVCAHRPHAPIQCPQHPTYDITKASCSFQSVILKGELLSRFAKLHAGVGVTEPPPSPRPGGMLAQVIKAALEEDAGDLGDVTTNAT